MGMYDLARDLSTFTNKSFRNKSAIKGSVIHVLIPKTLVDNFMNSKLTGIRLGYIAVGSGGSIFKVYILLEED
nr:hypothetical protein Iba_chr01bCG6600 [Ipomoea batatas]